METYYVKEKDYAADMIQPRTITEKCVSMNKRPNKKRNKYLQKKTMRNIGDGLVQGLHRGKTKAILKRGSDLVARVQRAGECFLAPLNLILCS